LKSARRRRAIEVAGPRSFWERGQRTQGGQSITAWRGSQRTKKAGKAFFVSALTRANPLLITPNGGLTEKRDLRVKEIYNLGFV